MDILPIFFDGWGGIVKILIAAPIMYITIILFIRMAGKRSTSQMNNFDWVVTVAIGSISASGIMLDNISVSEALIAISLLLFFQYLMTKSVFNSKFVSKIIKAKPNLLVHKGEYIREAMRNERVTEEEIMAAVRQNGLINIDDCQWVFLETDATFSVIPKDDRDFSSAQFEGVTGFPPEGSNS